MAESEQIRTRKKRGRMSAIRRKAAQAAFLAEFEQQANVSQSCRTVGIARDTLYQWLEHDETFTILYHQAKQIANDRHTRGNLQTWS